ncbi:MAG TPA: hypothetical protein VF749_10615 [Candidatus Acidoferrum sp.]
MAANPPQLTFGHNEADVQCSPDDTWVYYVDAANNFLPKRVAIDGGGREKVFDSALGGADLSPDGKTLVTLEVGELDHKLMLKFVSTENKAVWFHDMDQRASRPLRFTADGGAVVYTVRQKRCRQSLAAAAQQLALPPAQRISRRRGSPSSPMRRMARGSPSSAVTPKWGAVLLRDLTH